MIASISRFAQFTQSIQCNAGKRSTESSAVLAAIHRQSTCLTRAIILGLSLILTTIRPSLASDPDTIHRTAIVSAYEPEWRTLQASLEQRKEMVIDGTAFLTGMIEHKPVVLFRSGISMVNAAMTAQLALDHFTIDRIVFSGIAGGADPDLEIGDVVMPRAWSEYLEAVFAREKNGVYSLPAFASPSAPNFGMIFPQPVQVADEKKAWFFVDPQSLNLAGDASRTTTLAQCTASGQCLKHRPKIVVGENGVSSQAFVDNGAFREYIAKTFKASVIDMESTAVAHVAYANHTPFIAFRSVSDLAGGGGGAENEIGTFFQLASDNSATVVKAVLKTLP